MRGGESRGAAPQLITSRRKTNGEEGKRRERKIQREVHFKVGKRLGMKKQHERDGELSWEEQREEHLFFFFF